MRSNGPSDGFDLRAALGAWRRFLVADRVISAEDADELEAHLRDEIDDLQRQGCDREEAFRMAVRRIGDYPTLRSAYGAVYWTKQIHERRLANELRWRVSMLANYLKIGLRNLLRYRVYGAINIFGLAAGLACCMLILLYVQDELRYDRFHERADRIVRLVGEERKEGGIVNRMASTPLVLGPLLEEELPAVQKTVRFLRYGVFTDPLLRHSDRQFTEPGFFFADSTALEVFSFELVRGNPETALDAPLSVVLTRSTAAKYFGDTDPLGQILRLNGTTDLTVTGVLADLPAHSHIKFDLLASFSSLGPIEGPWVYHAWHWPPVYTYLLLPQGHDPATLQAQLPGVLQRRLRADVAEQWTLDLQPLTSIHLHSDLQDELQPNGKIAYVYLFAVIALLLLLIACINFTNLATARALGRAKEVGMRKVLGARRGQLLGQYLGESTVMAGLAAVLAIAMVLLLVPLFNDVAAKTLSPAALLAGGMPLILVGIVLAVGLIAGSYPGLYLSAFRPVQVLKDGIVPGASTAARLRKGLVVFQFAVSSVLIVGTLIVYRQLHFVQNARLGFDKEHVVVLRLPTDDAAARYPALKERLQRLPGVLAVSATSDVPPSVQDLYDFPVVLREGRTDSLEMLALTIDPDFAETFGIRVAAGRDLSDVFPSDATQGFLLNEEAARRLELDDPVGQALTLYHYAGDVPTTDGRVVGVIEDFHYKSLHSPIEPILFFVLPPTSQISYYNYLSVRLRPDGISESLAAMENEWRRFQPDRPFDATFLDARFDQLYRAEQRLGTLFGYFAGLTILIACLGLFGLAALAIRQRTREIGIRKVMGASVLQIVALLTGDFVKLVALAFVLAVPAAYFVMQYWLEGFAYRVHIGAGVFALAGGAALIVALLAVGYQAVKAARTNPADSLRYE